MGIFKTFKAYTDIEQSKKLAETLPIDSADMYYYTVNGDLCRTPNVIESEDDLYVDEKSIPCWSLAALLDVLDYAKCDIHKDIYGWKCYIQPNDFRYDSKWKDNPVDACVEVICERNDRLDELRRKYCDYDT